MWVRVTRFRVPPSRWDEATLSLREGVIPALRTQGLLHAGYWVGNRDSGEGVALVLADDQDHLRRSEPAAEQARSQAAMAFGVAFGPALDFEVIGQL